MKKTMLAISLALLSTTSAVNAADYVIDTKGAHAFVNFKIKHLGYSWLYGRFNDFEGQFSYDANNPNNAKIKVVIDTASIDSNHAERDKHLRGDDFLNVEEHPQATFTSEKITFSDATNGVVQGKFTLNGITKDIEFAIHKIGEGDDPWGGYRVGFSGNTQLKLSDYGIDYDLGPASTHVDIGLHIEGIRQ
ncbi:MULTISPECIES: YceI family protein [unclassified Pseudoalteromonas]|uniref:YceI family protein n=1 Tax=unclassified Pseudoalteromonas TaxID=194690 RepID=UPI0030151494